MIFDDRAMWRALVSTVMNIRVSKMRGISLLDAEPVNFSRSTLLHGVSKYVSMMNTFYYQLTHTTLKNVELLKHSKINQIKTLQHVSAYMETIFRELKSVLG